MAIRKKLDWDEFGKASTALWPAYEESCKILKDYLDGKIAGSDKVKVACITANAFKGLVQSESAKKAIAVTIERNLSQRLMIED